ncbi:MAG: hypothetical protein JST79_15370 [Acidobacteria bacterium]|nr:hypothetical protein [Acidobacteriota bacterium]
MRAHPTLKEVALLLLLAACALLVHGYHPYVEDAEIYVPGIKQALHHDLYPQNSAFFASHARMTLFPNLIAGSLRLTHLPLEWGLLLWHFASVFLLLLACWHIGRLCFPESLARWGGVAMIASLLTLPIAGTALYLMDQYLNTRSLSTPAALFMVAHTLERKYLRAGVWGLFTALIHPLMAVFGLSFVALLAFLEWRKHAVQTVLAAGLLLPLSFFPPVTPEYWEVLNRHSYFFLLRWEWYEWLGIFGPLFLLYWFARIARGRNLLVPERLCLGLIGYGLLFFVAAVVITVPASMARFVELQPLRSLHLLYILFFTVMGCLLAEFVLRKRPERWLLLFVPLCGGMFYAQMQLFPATAHVEWPGMPPHSDRLQAFLWIRDHTPVQAYFALDPEYMRLPGDDQHGFRAITERSRMADRIKDSGAVTMFPALARPWHEQVTALDGWQNFQAEDFRRLKERFGVDWVVVATAQGQGMTCPYQNQSLQVCQVP